MKNTITNPSTRDLANYVWDLAELIDTQLVPGSPAFIAAQWLERRAHQRIEAMQAKGRAA